ncbi:Nuclear body protein SP140-like protein [Channa argus]|uniref:Nuclear body protein SP140-like protein n=1 Tax=Channa argus TaxID=215402 RepID=A0A6G1QDD3_CHAAH|nr:Nuclear body protein SP140-like protein [Channa argus]
MDPLYFFESHELLQFFHRHKTELSCMDKPQSFLFQLRDHDLIPKDISKKVIRMRIRENQKRAIYEMLDWFETERPKHIRKFWRCVFKETILNEYPSLRLLRNSLMDGSYRDDLQPFESVEDEELHENKKKGFSEDKEEEKSKKKKGKPRSNSVCDDVEEEEQPGPSAQVTPGQKKKPNKISFSSPLKIGEKNIWTWPIYKFQLPVTCGELEGTLNKSRLAKGEACILFQKQWFTPGEFENRAGKKSCKNWKWSIRCNGTTLGKLIQEGHLEAAPYKGGAKKTKKSLFPSDVPNTVSDREENENEEGEDQFSSNDKESSTDDTEDEEEAEQQPVADDDSRNLVFKVTCGAASGTLHKKRFASGTRGKSIRTETRWMSPEEFLEEESGQTDGSWKKVIKCEGKPLGNLIEEGILKTHSLLCLCRFCKPDETELENQKNDDDCCVCKCDEDAELVVCDYCPRSFHQRCHLPYVDDTILKDDGKWMCTFCVFRNYTYIDEMEMNEALSRQISGRMLQCQYLLLHLRCADEDQTFASDPNLILSDYSTVIQTPMWLSQVANKLQTREYETVGEFVSDVNLIFTNCAEYNRDNAEFRAKGNRLNELFDRKFRSVFNIL